MQLKNSLTSLNAYTPNKQPKTIKLDANEANYNISNFTFPNNVAYHRYPDSFATSLTNKLANNYLLSPEELLVGSGSSELLELVVKSFVNPNEVVLSITPSFVMYEKYAHYYNANFQTSQLNKDGSLNLNHFLKTIDTVGPKVIFLATPNNPTGTSINQQDIITILKYTSALVVLDEAYIEFLGEDYSMIKKIQHYPNLLVARTFSKAQGLASLRVGYIAANKNLINQLKRVKTPYSVSQLSLDIALNALSHKELSNNYIKMINKNKKTVLNALKEITLYPLKSDANFLYLKTSFPLDTYLEKYNISIRKFQSDYYRITIPSDEELSPLLSALKELNNEYKNNIQ